MFRKRATPAPGFKQPAAYNPQSGQHAPIGKSFPHDRIAMMQVAEEDTHDNYVVCRGFDPECGKFLNSVNVAKPYGIRGTFPYVIGQVFAAAKPRTALGDTPGMAETTVGQPEDLDEVVVILTDDDGNPIAWLDLSVAAPDETYFFYPKTDTLIDDANATSSIFKTAGNYALYLNYAEGNGKSVTFTEAQTYDSGFATIARGGSYKITLQASIQPSFTTDHDWVSPFDVDDAAETSVESSHSHVYTKTTPSIQYIRPTFWANSKPLAGAWGGMGYLNCSDLTNWTGTASNGVHFHQDLIWSFDDDDTFRIRMQVADGGGGAKLYLHLQNLKLIVTRLASPLQAMTTW